MEEGLLSRIQSSLTTKRDILREWAQTADPDELQDVLGPAGEAAFERHLEVLDSALEQAEDHTLGLCTECHEPVESRLIQVDYTSCVCLEHFSDEERRHLQSELELAGAVQRSLVPRRPPDVAHLEIAAFIRPAQIVGGDYFDFFPFVGGRQGAVIADVAGHGMSSSLIMAIVQTMLRTLTQDHASPAELVARINRLCLHNIQFTTFITLFLAAFDPATGRVTYCNAGHNPPLILRRGGEAEWLSSTGAAVGLAEESAYRDQTIALHAGDLLLLYTDGVTETTSPEGILLGADRLAAAVREHATLPAQDLVEAVRHNLQDFAGGAAPADDVTLVLLRVVP